MIFYKRRTDRKAQLARKTVQECKRESKCPSCGNPLHLAEREKDRDMFVCESCNSVITFTKAPAEPANKADKKFSSFTLRDKTDHRKVENIGKNTDSRKPDQTKNATGMIDIIRTAMVGNYIVSFEYVDAAGNKSTRLAEPYKLTKRNGELVLYAFDLDGSSIRMFKLCGMGCLEQQAYGFKPRWDIEDKLLEKPDGGRGRGNSR